jgi:hypothetical protein
MVLLLRCYWLPTSHQFFGRGGRETAVSRASAPLRRGNLGVSVVGVPKKRREGNATPWPHVLTCGHPLVGSCKCSPLFQSVGNPAALPAGADEFPLKNVFFGESAMLFAAVLTAALLAPAESDQFSNGSWNETLKQAATAKKLIYVDFYTDW